MKRSLTEQEKLLIELIYYMANGTGIPVKDIKTMLEHPMPSKKGKNCLECLEAEGRAFLNEMITFMNELEDFDRTEEDT